MREIKFRCWNALAHTMEPWEKMVKMNKIHLIDENRSSYPIMQYTGLKDKNGVEVYDGDALRMNHDDGESNYAGIVCWVAEGDWLGWGLLVGRYHDELKVVNQSSIEVIGNIHQNPELLGDS